MAAFPGGGGEPVQLFFKNVAPIKALIFGVPLRAFTLVSWKQSRLSKRIAPNIAWLYWGSSQFSVKRAGRVAKVR